MKLTVIEKIADEEAIKLIQDISRSSNSQNKVSDADFFSTHPFHVQMEHFSQNSMLEPLMVHNSTPNGSMNEREDSIFKNKCA